MKKIVIVMMLVIAIGFMYNLNTVTAQEQTDGVKLDETNFPDQYVRQVLYANVDQNGDLILQQREIDKTTELYFDRDWMEGGDAPVMSPILNCKGLEIFKNLRKLTLIPESDKKTGLKNFDCIYKLKKLENLEVARDSVTQNYDFSKLKNLKSLYLTDFKCKNVYINNKKLRVLGITGLEVKRLSLKNLKQIKTMEIQYLKTPVLDLHSLQNLNKLEISFSEFKKLKLGKLHKLRSFDIYKHGTKLKNIDISGLKNVEYVSIFDIKNLEKIKIGNLKKLKELYIFLSEGRKNKKIKKLDISGTKNLKEFKLKGYSKLKKLKINEDQKFKYFCIENCKNLKSVDMKNVRITKHIIIDKRIRLLNFNKKNKKYLKRI